MKGLFRAFEAEGVRYLLIGGQAAVLYGASHFTSDIDLWLQPGAANVAAFLRALARVSARVHKLTPPLHSRWIRAGHGFHFVIPAGADGSVYLDVMGHPPRVGPFGPAARRSVALKTAWGTLQVVAIEDLAELKKTNRPGDYEVISRLARIRLGQAERVDARLVRWALSNSFRAEDVLAIRETYPALARRIEAARGAARDARILARQLDRRLLALLDEGRRYWTPRIRQLKELRAAGELLPEGTPVAEIS